MRSREWQGQHEDRRKVTTAEERKARVLYLGGDGAYVYKIGKPEVIYKISAVMENTGWVQLETVTSRLGQRNGALVNPLSLEKAEPPQE